MTFNAMRRNFLAMLGMGAVGVLTNNDAAASPSIPSWKPQGQVKPTSGHTDVISSDEVKDLARRMLECVSLREKIDAIFIERSRIITRWSFKEIGDDEFRHEMKALKYETLIPNYEHQIADLQRLPGKMWVGMGSPRPLKGSVSEQPCYWNGERLVRWPIYTEDYQELEEHLYIPSRQL